MAIAALSHDQSAPPVEAPIDLVRLAANTLGDRDLEVQVLRLFVMQSKTILDRLNTETDAQHQADLVHTLKGSARGVGAEAVAACCEGLEADLRAGDSAEFNGLRAAVEETNAFISDLLDE